MSPAGAICQLFVDAMSAKVGKGFFETSYAGRTLLSGTLVEILLQETTKALGRNASLLGKQIEIRRRNGNPESVARFRHGACLCG